ncbi:glutamate receptor ionotropic, kainate 2-like [Cydia splendana]|uniref:glutamate receptor ionotropic, kainate 2-like n=1 Tax=Cydia splendana TaxID=1100963 RepID=UPI0021314E1D
MWRRTLLFSIFMQTCLCQIRHIHIEEKSQLNIVGIFEPGSGVEMGAFNESMNSAVGDGNRRLEPIIIKPTASDSYSVVTDLCTDDSIRTIAVLGPHNLISDRGVLNHCSKLNIPYLQATWQPFDPDSEEEEDIENSNDNEEDENDENEEQEYKFKNIAINFFPDANEVANAYADVLKFYNWESFIVLYEDDYGLLRVQKIISNYSTNFYVIFRKLDPEAENYEIFKELSKMQESRIILDCHVDNILKYIEVAAKLNMLNSYQHYTLTSMDTSRVADQLTTYASNFTWLSLAEYEKLSSAQGSLNSRVSHWNNGISLPVVKFPNDALLMDDVARHVLEAAEKSSIPPDSQGKLCSSEPWEYGAKLQEHILNTTTTGVTGIISFDPMTGRRKDYTLYLNEIHQSHLHTIATWKSEQQEFVSDEKAIEILSNQSNTHHFKVMSRPAEPYIAKKKCYIDHLPGPDCEEDDDGLEYEGFSVDLVTNIFKVLKDENPGYTFEFVYDPNITYGKYDTVQKKWDGLIGKLLDKQADLVVCDLTMTEARKKLVDFSVPIMTVGISILFTKDNKVPIDTLSFLKPYSVEMWIYTGTAYCIVSIVLFVCSRISPGDWENPQPCEKEPEELENIWNFKNSTWLTMGSIMTQGCDILPKAFGSRWVCAMWWFFAMIVCQTYIAQLAASLTSAMENAPIEGIEDLAKQTKVLYGAFEAGSTIEFFKNSKDKMYRKIYENMIATPGVLVESNEVGEKRVLASKNKFAFFMESASIEYKMKRNCLLKKVGGELDSKDYGIGMPANSPHRSKINRAILKLKENNKLNDIKDKWWNEKFGAIPCEDTVDLNDVEGDLELENLAGAFYVLIGGLFVALFITAAEFMNEVQNIVVARRREVTHKEAFMAELKASLNFFQLQKPVMCSRAPSIASRGSSQRSLKSQKSNRSNVREQFLTNFLEFEKGQNL